MRTLLVSEIFPPKTGGSGRWFWEIYRRLPREEFLIAAGEDPRQEAFDQTHDLRLWRLPLTMRQWGLRSFEGLRGYWRSVRRLRRLARAEGVRMVHAGRCLPEGIMALGLKCRCRIPYACYVHGEDVNAASTSREQSWLVRRALGNAAYVIPNSKNTERILREDWHLPPERIHLLHPGVDTDRFVPAPHDASVRQRLGWRERPVVLTVGRLQKRKGHDHMILALDKIRAVIPNVLYTIIGDGEERGFLQQLVAQHKLQDHVQFLGETDDTTLVQCYQQCNLFALPNRQVGRDIEGFGMVLLEAQACGRPVLAGDSGGTAETMRVPETGRIADCTNSDTLAAVVIDLLREPDRLDQMGRLGREWVVATFDWKALSQQAQRIFAGLPGTAAPADKKEMNRVELSQL
jgi:phosphatidylinositol alpha-1,6-mannosyltransferase